MSIKSKTTGLVLLASLLASTSSFAQSSVKHTPRESDFTVPAPTKKVDGFGVTTETTYYPMTYKYQFVMDCFDRNINHADTKDAVSVFFKLKSSETVEGKQTALLQRELSAPNCGRFGHARYQIDDSGNILDISSVKVETSGSDALWVDEASLEVKLQRPYKKILTSKEGAVTTSSGVIDQPYKYIQQWGRDGGNGYCLSIDPSDADAYKGTIFRNACYTHLIFKVGGGVDAPKIPAKPKPLTIYNVDIKTSDKRGAGTDSNIYLTLNGSQGKVGGSTGVLLNPKISGNAFERNDIDKVRLTSRSDIGLISSIFLRSDGNHPGADWNVKYVRVNGVTFNCGDREIEGAGSMTCSR